MLFYRFLYIEDLYIYLEKKISLLVYLALTFFFLPLYNAC